MVLTPVLVLKKAKMQDDMKSLLKGIALYFPPFIVTYILSYNTFVLHLYILETITTTNPLLFHVTYGESRLDRSVLVSDFREQDWGETLKLMSEYVHLLFSPNLKERHFLDMVHCHLHPWLTFHAQ